MKITSNYNVQRDSLPEAPSWIDRLLSPLNKSISELQLATQQRLTIGDNLVGLVTSVQVLTGSTGNVTSMNPPLISWQFPQQQEPNSILVGRIIAPSNVPPIVAAVSIPSWTYTFSNETRTGSIRIPVILGLGANASYTINLVVL